MRSVKERFDKKFKVNEETGCWEWTGALYRGGYGAFWTGEMVTCAHRTAYKIYCGEIPEGMVLDHLCRNRACVNPDHLEPVTARENLHRGNTQYARTHCPNGHPYDRLYMKKRGSKYYQSRSCSICSNEKQNLRWRQKKERK